MAEYKNELTGEIEYPSDFGGMYINDNQKLVIQLVKNSKTNAIIRFVTSNVSDDIVYQYVDNSNEELEKVNNIIMEYFSNSTSIYEGFKANYVDVVNNVVVVELKNNNIEEQTWFKENVIDSELITFIQNENINVETSSYNAGSIFTYYKNGTGPYNCSIGYRAKRNGAEGFVTAAHCVEKGINYYGYGTAMAESYSPYEGLDGAFVQLTTGHSVTNNIEGTSTTIGTTTSTMPIFGVLVSKSGYKTGVTSGQITNVNYSSVINDKDQGTSQYWQHLVKTSVTNQKGDSGGIVYSSGNPASVMGIVHGCTLISGSNDCSSYSMSYSRADLINNSLGLTRY